MTPQLPEARAEELRQTVKGYAELEKVARQFLGKAAMVQTAREKESPQ